LNPLRAGVVKSLEELNRYRWSGHGVLIGKCRNDWQAMEYVHRQFHARKGRAIQAYSDFMEEGKSQGRRPELIGGGLVRSLGGWSRVLTMRGSEEKVEHDARILGGGEFVADILQEADRVTGFGLKVINFKKPFVSRQA